VSRAIFRAYETGCKGFTYYRDGSRTEQVVTFSKDNDLAGGNRDVAPAAAVVAPSATPETAVATGTQAGTGIDLDIDALLAKANALLEAK
jgi:ribonucleotide reductase alpha subunit